MRKAGAPKPTPRYPRCLRPLDGRNDPLPHLQPSDAKNGSEEILHHIGRPNKSQSVVEGYLDLPRFYSFDDVVRLEAEWTLFLKVADGRMPGAPLVTVENRTGLPAGMGFSEK